MANVKRGPTVKTSVATLRRRVRQGDMSAMSDLVMWLQEGFQDRKGRTVVLRDPGDYFCRTEI